MAPYKRSGREEMAQHSFIVEAPTRASDNSKPTDKDLAHDSWFGTLRGATH